MGHRFSKLILFSCGASIGCHVVFVAVLVLTVPKDTCFYIQYGHVKKEDKNALGLQIPKTPPKKEGMGFTVSRFLGPIS